LASVANVYALILIAITAIYVIKAHDQRSDYRSRSVLYPRHCLLAVGIIAMLKVALTRCTGWCPPLGQHLLRLGLNLDCPRCFPRLPRRSPRMAMYLRFFVMMLLFKGC